MVTLLMFPTMADKSMYIHFWGLLFQRPASWEPPDRRRLRRLGIAGCPDWSSRPLEAKRLDRPTVPSTGRPAVPWNGAKRLDL